MIGGDDAVVQRIEPDFFRAGPANGFGAAHAWPREDRRHSRARLLALRPSGAGHFVKMVHNGIEYDHGSLC